LSWGPALLQRRRTSGSEEDEGSVYTMAFWSRGTLFSCAVAGGPQEGGHAPIAAQAPSVARPAGSSTGGGFRARRVPSVSTAPVVAHAAALAAMPVAGGPSAKSATPWVVDPAPVAPTPAGVMVAAAPALDAPRGKMCKADADEFRSMGESILEHRLRRRINAISVQIRV
jgi:hypothetical protein